MKNNNFYEMMKVDGYYEAEWMNEDNHCTFSRVATVNAFTEKIRHFFHK